MQAELFKNLYTKQGQDETITPFQNEAGFSLIRSYPQGTKYHTDGMRMFMKVAVLNEGLFYAVDMTKPEQRGGKAEYIITGGEKYKNKVTNFYSDNKNTEFVFDELKNRIRHSKTKKEFTLNEFVEVLAKNHLSDCLFWKRKVNWFVDILLRFLFWLSDKRYEKVKVSLDIYHFTKDNKPMPETEKSIEPFFKYFYISKNLIFVVLLTICMIAVFVALFPCWVPLESAWRNMFGEFTLSNPMVVLLFFLGLFSLEKIFQSLNKKINIFLMPNKNSFSSEIKKNFIEKLHNHQYHNKFDLKV